MFKFLSDIPTVEVIAGIYRVVRFLRHQAVIQGVNRSGSGVGSSIEAAQVDDEIAFRILEEIRFREERPGVRAGEAITTETYINDLADIAQNRAREEPGYNLERGRHLLNELRQFQVANTSISLLDRPALTVYADVQRILADTWQAVLEVERVDIDSNFFDLGGNSLDIVLVHRRLKSGLGIDISLVDMFTYPTVSSLAAYITQNYQDLATQVKDGRAPGDADEPSIKATAVAPSHITDQDNSLQWYLNITDQDDSLQWYLIKTHPGQESRAEANLKAWQLETLMPKLKVRKKHPWAMVEELLPLFPRYVFARFNAAELLHKVVFTRGIYSVVSFENTPTPVESSIIALLQSRVDSEGIVLAGEYFRPHDELEKPEPIRNFMRVFDEELKVNDRINILLTTVREQALLTLKRRTGNEKTREKFQA
jgi:transcription antitermination factor NusG/acyl carrier protein